MVASERARNSPVTARERWPIATAILATAVLLSACSPSRMIESKALLEDLAAGGGPSTLKAETAPPERRLVRFGADARQHEGHLYRPGDGAADAALVVVPGVTPAGKDDRRFVAFARSLARTRFEVLVPEIANLRALKVGPGDAEPIADALRALTGDGRIDEEASRPRKAGIVAISYAAGPAVLAALDPAARDRVAFLLLIGGYRDITAVVTYFTTGHYRAGPGAPWRRGTPQPRAKWAFLESNLSLIEDPADAEALGALAQRKTRRPEADIADLVAGLGPEGRSIIALLTNRDPDAVPELITGLPERIAADMRGIDLAAHDLSKLRAKLILVHGRDDPVIPYTESEALAAAATGTETSLTLLDNLPHVDLGAPGTEDALRLWAAAYRVLEERDRLAKGE